jgi:anti-sigma regulatory factor (Ser/Thr protein kinase)
MARQAKWVFPAESGAVPDSRALLAERLQDVPQEALEVVLLLASELVTNAVRHGAGPVAVHVTWDAEGVHVEVADQSPGLPVLRAVDPEAISGRGLILVDGLSSGWGVLGNTRGKIVWFTVDL